MGGHGPPHGRCPLTSSATTRQAPALAGRYLEGPTALFAERVAAGRAHDGHGDLRADDISCLDDGPRVLDCLEYDDRLGYGDVLYDVAFLPWTSSASDAPISPGTSWRPIAK